MGQTEWISVKDRLPETGQNVLIIKQLKSGMLTMAIGYCIREYSYNDPVTKQLAKRPYWVCGGNNNVIFWMPLPEMPEVSK